MPDEDTEHEHDGYSLQKLEVPLEDGCHVLGWTVQVKTLNSEGGLSTLMLQSPDLNDFEAAGMVRAHQLLLDQDLLGGAHDPRDSG